MTSAGLSGSEYIMLPQSEVTVDEDIGERKDLRVVVIRMCNGLLFERRVIIFAHVLRTTCDLRTF